MESNPEFRIIYYNIADSTNRLTRQLAEQKKPEGFVVVVGRQTAGKGRGEKNWFSVPGKSLTFSILLRPKKKLAEQCPQLALILGLSLAKIIENLGFNPYLKWPNDVILNGKKIAGILLENSVRANRLQWVVAGIGVNLNIKKVDFPLELREVATSLFIEGRREIDPEIFLQEFLLNFSFWYSCWLENREMQSMLDEYTKRSMILGCTVTYENQGRRCQGQAERIDENGGLWIIDKGERYRLSWGEVSIVTDSKSQTQSSHSLGEEEMR